MEVLNATSTDHSPVLCSLQNLNRFQRGLSLWKLNLEKSSDSLVSNEEKC